MYREQNYIFSFTFVYKSKTACLIKHLLKKRKRKEKNKHPQTESKSVTFKNGNQSYPNPFPTTKPTI